MRPADKLQLKAAAILPLVGLARSKQDPINRGHGAQYLYRPPPAGATDIEVASNPRHHHSISTSVDLTLRKR